MFAILNHTCILSTWSVPSNNEIICEITQSSCKRDIKSKSHVGMKLAPVRVFSCKHPLTKQPTFGDVATGFPAKWRLRSERRNSILMTRHYPVLGSASDWSCRVGNLIQPIRSTTQIRIVTRHQYGFLRSFLRRHLAGKPVVASPNGNFREFLENFRHF